MIEKMKNGQIILQIMDNDDEQLTTDFLNTMFTLESTDVNKVADFLTHNHYLENENERFKEKLRKSP